MLMNAPNTAPMCPLQPVLKRCPSPEFETTNNYKAKDPAAQPAAPVKQRRNVSFFQVVTIKAHTHFLDMTPAEIDATWYKKQHYTQMKENCIPALRLIVRGEYTGDTDEICKRGLEYRTRATAQQRKINKLNSIRAVFSAQDVNRMNGEEDNDERIRASYVETSEPHRVPALKKALEDWRAAKEIYEDDLRAMQEAFEEEAASDEDDSMTDESEMSLELEHVSRPTTTRPQCPAPAAPPKPPTDVSPSKRSPLRKIFKGRGKR